MARITIAGDAVVVTSSMKLEDIRTIAKYRPEALILKGGDDGKEPIFAVGVTKGNGSINQYGASFSPETHNEDGLATITIVVNGSVDGDIKDFVADRIGSAIINLNKLEESLPCVVEEINAEKAAVIESITIA